MLPLSLNHHHYFAVLLGMNVCHLQSSHSRVLLHLTFKLEGQLPVLCLAQDPFSEVAGDGGDQLLIVEARGVGKLPPELRHFHRPADAELKLVIRPVDEPVVGGHE